MDRNIASEREIERKRVRKRQIGNERRTSSLQCSVMQYSARTHRDMQTFQCPLAHHSGPESALMLSLQCEELSQKQQVALRDTESNKIKKEKMKREKRETKQIDRQIDRQIDKLNSFIKIDRQRKSEGEIRERERERERERGIEREKRGYRFRKGQWQMK